jgi:alpha/beta superfamily hydrolase
VRFNYRGVGLSAGEFSEEGAREDFRAAVDATAARFGPCPIWALGYSLGAWVAMTAGAADSRVEALLGVAPVVGDYDFDAIVTSETPKFLVAAGADELTPAKQVQKFYGRLCEPRELVVVDGADHAFTGMAIEVGDAVEQLLGAN